MPTDNVMTIFTADLNTSSQFLKSTLVSQRVVFKTALMVWKCVHGVAPAYLSDLGVPATAISGRQHPRSAATGTILVPRARAATGQRSFVVNGPSTWNRLPPALRSSDLSESAFKRALKTHLFSTARRHWDVFMILAPDINIQTYLLTYHILEAIRQIFGSESRLHVIYESGFASRFTFGWDFNLGGGLHLPSTVYM